MSQGRYALVGLLWFAFLLNYVDRQAAFSIFPALERDLGFTSMQLGWIGTVFIWTYSVGVLIAGKLADWLPRRALVVASLVLWSLAMLGTSYSQTTMHFLIGRGAMGLTEALYFPAAVALIAGVHGPATRSRALAVHHSAQMAGSAVGGWFGGWSADHVGWRAGFGSLAWVGVAYAIVLTVAFRWMNRAGAGASEEFVPVAEAQSGGGPRRELIALFAGFFFFCGLLWMIYAWLPSHYYGRFGLTMAQAGWNATLYLQASTFVGILVGGYLGDKQNRLRVTATGLWTSPLFGYVVFAAPSLMVANVAAIAFGLSAGLFQANAFALAFDFVSARRRGITSGLLNASGGIAGGISILAAGSYRDSIGIVAPVLACALATALAGLFLRFAPRQRMQLR